MGALKLIDVVMLMSQKDWYNQVLEQLEQIPQPKRGPRRDNNQIINNYFNLVAGEILLNLRDQYQEMFDLYHIRRDLLKRRLGHFTLNSRRNYWLNWFEQQPFSLYTVVQKGDNLREENTIVKLNFDFLNDLELEHVPREQIIEHYNQLNKQDPTDVLATPIDLKSLRIFIERARYSRVNKQRWDSKKKCYVRAHKRWLEKNNKNLKIAVQMLKLAEPHGELIQPMRTSAFGRIYLGGINLQSSRAVRHAALGHCYSIDFNVCSTAWRLHMAQQIDPTFTAPETLNYIKNKRQFRWAVARLLGQFYTDDAKSLLTSIGFGANLTDKPWPSGTDNYTLPAVREIVDEYQIESLMASDWFMRYINEQEAMNKIICDHTLKQLKKTEVADCVKDAAKRIQKNKVMAFLYQHAEMEYLTDLLNYIIARFGREEILLTVHDCVYIKHKINLAEINSRLQQLNPYLVAEITEHWGHFDPEDKPSETTDSYTPIFTEEQVNELLRIKN